MNLSVLSGDKYSYENSLKNSKSKVTALVLLVVKNCQFLNLYFILFENYFLEKKKKKFHYCWSFPLICLPPIFTYHYFVFFHLRFVKKKQALCLYFSVNDFSSSSTIKFSFSLKLYTFGVRTNTFFVNIIHLLRFQKKSYFLKNVVDITVELP